MTGSDSKLFYLAVGENIRKYRDLRNYSLQILGEKVGVTKKTIQRYELGEIKIDVDRLKEIAVALDVDVVRLLEGTESFLGVELNDLATVKLPIINRIEIIKGNVSYTDIEGYEITPRDWLSEGGEHFYLRAKDNSLLSARIQSGDLLLIKKQSSIQSGDVAVIHLNGEIIIKKAYITEGQLLLQSDQESPILVPLDNANIIGKLKKVLFNL